MTKPQLIFFRLFLSIGFGVGMLISFLGYEELGGLVVIGVALIMVIISEVIIENQIKDNKRKMIERQNRKANYIFFMKQQNRKHYNN